MFSALGFGAGAQRAGLSVPDALAKTLLLDPLVATFRACSTMG